MGVPTLAKTTQNPC